MGLLEQILRYLDDLTAKRFFLLVLVLFLTAGAALYYERYTASFALTRLEKAALLLKELESSKYESASAKEISEMHHEISKQLHALLVEERAKTQTLEAVDKFLIPEKVWLWKFVVGGVPWLFMALVLFFFSKSSSERWLGVFGFIVIALFFAGIGSILPTIYWPWFNMVLYPALSFGLIVLPATLIPAFRKVRETSIKKAVLNNLRMIAAASDQYFLENGVNNVEIEQIVGPDKYIKNLIPIAGESYTSLVIRQGQPIQVRTNTGEIITYSA